MDLTGIDHSMLEYNIRLSSDTADYGFKGIEKDGLLEFTIPALSDIIKESEMKKLKSVKIEVNDKENKYYLKPFNADMKFEVLPKASVSINIEEDIKKEIKIDLKKEDEQDNNVPVPKTRISNFLK
jgi:hypothetical protein